MHREESVQFALGQLVPLGIAPFLLTLILIPTLAVGAAQQPSSTAPSVAGGTTLGRPSADLTGTTLLDPKQTNKTFELTKQAVLRIARVAVLWQPDAYGEGSMKPVLQSAGKAAAAMGLSLQFVPAADPAELETAFSEITRGQPDAVIVMPSAMLVAEHEYITKSIAKIRLPAMYSARKFVQDGGLMSYGATVTPIGRPDQPTNFELVVNLKTARELGITFSREFLMLVNETVE